MTIATIRDKEVNIVLNESNLNTRYLLKFVKSNIHGYTCSIKTEYGTKKLAFASGYGYDKTAHALASFVKNYILDNDKMTHDDIMQVYNYIDAGAVSNWGDVDKSKFIKFFELLGIDAGMYYENKNTINFILRNKE